MEPPSHSLGGGDGGSRRRRQPPGGGGRGTGSGGGAGGVAPPAFALLSDGAAARADAVARAKLDELGIDPPMGFGKAGGAMWRWRVVQ